MKNTAVLTMLIMIICSSSIILSRTVTVFNHTDEDAEVVINQRKMGNICKSPQKAIIKSGETKKISTKPSGCCIKNIDFYLLNVDDATFDAVGNYTSLESKDIPKAGLTPLTRGCKDFKVALTFPGWDEGYIAKVVK
jgi:hypothetical protein